MTLFTDFENNINEEVLVSRQQPAWIQLGQLALSDIALPDLLSRSAAFIAHTLAVDYVLIWELQADTDFVSLQAGTGWGEKRSDHRSKPLDENSHENPTLTSHYPNVIENLKEKTRFGVLSLLLEYGTTCGMSIPMGSTEKLLGVIEVFAREPRVFSQEDCLLLQSAATVLALAIDRDRFESRLQSENQDLKSRLAKLQTVIRSSQRDWDKFEIKNRLVESREKERLRLAQELHDVPIQDLYGLIYQMDEMKDYIKSPEGEQALNDYNQVLHRIVNNLRNMCRDLRPPSLSPFGLEVAIRDHVGKFREQNPDINVHLHLMQDRQEFSDGLRLNLFRIYQQAINNVSRHAEATAVHIRFAWDEDMIVLEVEDNGKGFEVPRFWVELVRNDHFGLVGLAERVDSIRGKLEIASAPGHGTLVRALVPRH